MTKSNKFYIGSIIIVISILFVYRVAAHAFFTHTIYVEDRQIELNEASNSLKSGYGLDFPHTFTDLKTENDGSMNVVASYYGRESKIEYYSIDRGSLENPKEFTVYTRKVSNLFTQIILDYSVQVSVSRYSDGAFKFDISPSGGGHAGYTVKGRVLGGNSKGFQLQVQETVFGDTFEYRIEVDCENFTTKFLN